MTPKELAAKFDKLLAHNDQRKATGTKDHNRLLADQKAGRPATGYRSEWIAQTAIAMVGLLGKACQTFDQKYLGDRASSDDCLTVLLTAMNLVVSRHGYKLEAEGKTFRIVPIK